MRPSLLLVMFGAGLLSIPIPQKAAAAPVTTTVPHIASAVANNSIEKIYYYRGRYYPYYYHGGYYPSGLFNALYLILQRSGLFGNTWANSIGGGGYRIPARPDP